MRLQGFAQNIRVSINVGQHQIRHQLLARRPIDIDHIGFAHTGMLMQTRFDFAQLDAQATNFHLMVDTPGVFDHALVAITRQVAGSV